MWIFYRIIRALKFKGSRSSTLSFFWTTLSSFKQYWASLISFDDIQVKIVDSAYWCSLLKYPLRTNGKKWGTFHTKNICLETKRERSKCHILIASFQWKFSLFRSPFGQNLFFEDYFTQIITIHLKKASKIHKKLNKHLTASTLFWYETSLKNKHGWNVHWNINMAA